MGTCFPGIIINSVFFLDVENRFVVIKGERSEGGKNWKFEVSTYKLLFSYTGWVNNKLFMVQHRELYSVSCDKP